MSSAAEADLAGLYSKWIGRNPNHLSSATTPMSLEWTMKQLPPARQSQWTFNSNGFDAGIHRASLDTSGHPVLTTLATTSQITILQSITCPKGRYNRFHSTALNWLQSIFLLFSFLFLTMLTARVCRSTCILHIDKVPVNIYSRSVLQRECRNHLSETRISTI